MTKSELAKKLDVVQSAVYKDLKSIGFRKRGRNLNRVLESGFTHVINFQMAQYQFDHVEDVPPIRVNLYGKFTLNLGVFVPEAYMAISNREIPKYVHHSECEINTRVGSLMPDEETWISLESGTTEMISQTTSQIHSYALPYLSRFETRQNILHEWENHGKEISLFGRPGLLAATLYMNSQNPHAARQIVVSEINNTHNGGYKVFVKKFAARIGIEIDE